MNSDMEDMRRNKMKKEKTTHSVVLFKYRKARKGKSFLYVSGTSETPLAHLKKAIHTGNSLKRNKKHRRPFLIATSGSKASDWEVIVLEETTSQKRAERLEEENIRNLRGEGLDLVKSKKGFNQTYRTVRADSSTREKIAEGNRNRSRRAKRK